MTTPDTVPDETRKIAEQRVRYVRGEAQTVVVIGPLLAGFGAFLLAVGTEEAWMAWILIGMGALVTLIGLARVVRTRRALSVARRGTMVEASVLQIQRRPGQREGDPNEYSICVELPGDEPRSQVYLRALIPPEQARELFGSVPPSMQTIEPRDLCLPVLVHPERPGEAVLAV